MNTDFRGVWKRVRPNRDPPGLGSLLGQDCTDAFLPGPQWPGHSPFLTSTSCSTCRPRVALSGLGVTPGAHSTTRGALKGEGGWGRDRGEQLVSVWAWAGGQGAGVSSYQTLGTAGLPGIRKLIDLILRVEEIQGKLWGGRGGRVLRILVSILLPTACALPGSPFASSSQSPSFLETPRLPSTTEAPVHLHTPFS